MFHLKERFRQCSDHLASPAVVARFFPPPAREPLVWDRCTRLLVVKLDEIGDFVLATPFLRNLRKAAPQAHVTLVVKPAVANLAETCPYVDQLFVYDGQTRGLAAWQLRRQWRALRLARRSLRRPRADAAVVLRWGEDAYNATILAALARPRAVVAYSETATPVKAQMNRGTDALVSHVLAPAAPRHEVEHNLAILEAFGGTVADTHVEAWPTEADRDFARSLLPAPAGYLALAPGALDPRRRWPADKFSALAGWARQEQGLTPVVFGGPGDPILPGAIDLRGRTTLRQAAAALARCRLFVGNDSGLKHLAAAAQVPVVEVSAFRPGGDPNHGNSPARFRAWGVATRVVQPPAGHDVLAPSEIDPGLVRGACAELLAATADPTPASASRQP